MTYDKFLFQTLLEQFVSHSEASRALCVELVCVASVTDILGKKTLELKLRSDGVEIKCRLGGSELSLPNRAHGVVLVVELSLPYPA